MTLPPRFMEKVKIVGECWEWTSTFTTNGYVNYGQYWHNKKTIYAHRYAWEFYNGSIPKGMVICHKCDNGICVNPEHLFLGTHKDNMRDMVNKGRQARGDRHGAMIKPESILRGEKNRNSKLTEEIVNDIRSNCVSGSRGQFSTGFFAKKYGVDRSTIIRIMNGRRWNPFEGKEDL